jgi:hypothetical protein
MNDFPTQRLNPAFRYCVADFKGIVDYGAASTHGGNYCNDCRHCRKERCEHPRLATSFTLGTHPDRMGCRHAFEPKN